MAILTGLLNLLLVISSVFLICLVLIQRGKGGGLAGAFGGVGGSSAFGTKAGDVFTQVTIYTAVVWFVLAGLLVIVNNSDRRSAFDLGGPAGTAVQVDGAAKGKTAVPPAGKSTVPPAKSATGSTLPAPVTPATPKPSASEALNSDLPSALEDEPPAKGATPAKPADTKTP